MAGATQSYEVRLDSLRVAAGSVASTSDTPVVALERVAPRSAAVTTDVLQPGVMRRLACVALDWWGLEALSDDIALVISELVTNALQHGGGSPASASPTMLAIPCASKWASARPAARMCREVTLETSAGEEC